MSINVNSLTLVTAADGTEYVMLTDPSTNAGSVVTLSNMMEYLGDKTFTDLNSKTIVDALVPLAGQNPGIHNAIFRGKSLGSGITTAQNTAIQNRTYDDMFIGDYWTINSRVWRIAAFDYYYKVGDTSLNKGNVIVVPDASLYSEQMYYTAAGTYVSGDGSCTDGGYSMSHMYLDNYNGGVADASAGNAGLYTARSYAATDFGSNLCSHRVCGTNATSNGKPSGWAWRDSDGVEIMNEIQVYGTQTWGLQEHAPYDIGTQKQQFPLFAIAPQFVNTGASYWLQDVVDSETFAVASSYGRPLASNSSTKRSVRPAVTLTYT